MGQEKSMRDGGEDPILRPRPAPLPSLAEAEGGRVESEEEVADLGPSEDEFGIFSQVNLSEDSSGDLGDPNLTEADLLSVGTSSQAEIGFKRKPPTNLFDLIEG